MSKLKLEIESLQVESFDTADHATGPRGTVRAASILPAPESVDVCFDSEITGPCCDYTLMLSCIETQCDECLDVPPSARC